MARVTGSFWHRCAIRRAGKRDGRARIPAEQSSALGPYEGQLLERCQQHLTDLQRKATEALNSLEGELESAVNQLRESVVKYEAAVDRYRRRRSELGRGVMIHMSPGKYLAAMLTISLGELVLNVQAFQVFQKPWLYTFLMSLVIAVGLPVSAHFVGVKLKQWPSRQAGHAGGNFWKTTAVFVAAIALGVGCIFAVNQARAVYLAELDASLASRESILNRSFLLINLFVYSVAILMSYFAHDSDQDFENTYNEMTKLDAQCARLSHRVSLLLSRIDGARSKTQAEMRRVKHLVGELVLLYRYANLRARDSKDVKSFESQPAIPDPPPLDELQAVTKADEIIALTRRWTDAHMPASDVGGPTPAPSPS